MQNHLQDKVFSISSASIKDLYAEANSVGCSVGMLFRKKAAKLAKCQDPTFYKFPGLVNRPFNCGLSDGVFLSLKLMAERLGIPQDHVGEMICSFDSQDGTQ